MAKIQSYEEFVEALEQDELKKTSIAIAEEDEDDEEEESNNDIDAELADLEKESEKEESEKEESEEEESEEEESEKEESEKEESEEEESEKEESEEEESDKQPASVSDDEVTVESISKNLYEYVKKEAVSYDEDMHDEHTIESYLKENTVMVAGMIAGALKELKEAKEDYTIEMYEASCETLKEAFVKKIDEMKEAYSAEGQNM